MDQGWISTGEAARRLGCDAQTVINYIRAGILLGAQDRGRGRWRVLESSVERLLEARRQQVGRVPMNASAAVA
jgi:excisionase family DNA binding protein